STRRRAPRWWSSNKSPAKGVRRKGTGAARPLLIAVGYFLQQLVNGLELGSLYALVTLGYTLIYGILELLNFAHGDVFMVGAFLAAGAAAALVHNEIAAIPGAFIVVLMLLVAMGGAGVLGVAIERVAYRPLRNANRLAPLITAIGL